MSKEMWCAAYDEAKEELRFTLEVILGREPTDQEWKEYVKKNEDRLCKKADAGAADMCADLIDQAMMAGEQ